MYFVWGNSVLIWTSTEVVKCSVQYNPHMGGVDREDQCQGYYPVCCVQCNHHMGGVDQEDQCRGYSSCVLFVVCVADEIRHSFCL